MHKRTYIYIHIFSVQLPQLGGPAARLCGESCRPALEAQLRRAAGDTTTAFLVVEHAPVEWDFNGI